MKRLVAATLVSAALGVAAFQLHAQNAPAQNPRTANPPAATTPAPNPEGQPATPQAPRADPYATNAAPGTLTFPLAAPAGKDSNAKAVAPPGAVNQGLFDP